MGRMVIATLAAAFVFSAKAAFADTTITYVANDHLGSPIVATDAHLRRTWHKIYRPYGREQAPDVDTTPGFTGHSRDAESELVYAGARYYAPELGRFLAMDPVSVKPAFPAGFNRYAYANNNPVGFIDPDGRQAVPSQEDSSAQQLLPGAAPDALSEADNDFDYARPPVLHGATVPFESEEDVRACMELFSGQYGDERHLCTSRIISALERPAETAGALRVLSPHIAVLWREEVWDGRSRLVQRIFGFQQRWPGLAHGRGGIDVLLKDKAEMDVRAVLKRLMRESMERTMKELLEQQPREP